MNSSPRSLLALATLALLGSLPLVAQPAATPAAAGSAIPAPRVRTSPHETISTVIDGNRVTVTYGRPYSKDPKGTEIRKIWGGLVRSGKVDRAGADEATLLITQQPIELGGAAIPAGAYSLYTLLSEDGSLKLIVNKEVGQWGVNHDGSTTRNEQSDVAQITLAKESLDQPIDQFTIALTKGAPAGGVLILAWEKTKYSAPFTVKK